MATIKIQRKNIQEGSYKIFIDGQEIGVVLKGEIKDTFEISPGEHTLVIKFGVGSNKAILFNINENETKVFSVTGFDLQNFHLLALIGVIFTFLLPFMLKTSYRGYYLFLIFLPYIVFLIRYVINIRKTWLIVKEIKTKV